MANTMQSKRKVLFLNFLPSITSRYVDSGSSYPSTAIMLLATLLKQQGYVVKIIDGGYYENYLEQIDQYIKTNKDDILFAGMSVMTTQVPFALEASQRIKTNNEIIPVIWGGPHATLFPEQVLASDSVDVAVINEGANTVMQLAKVFKAQASFSNVKGIAYRDSSGNCMLTKQAPMDSFDIIPHIDFSLIDIQNYLGEKTSVYQREFPRLKEKIRIMPIVTGLGCPFKCRFCINVILKRRYRFREAEDIVVEIKRLQKKYNANTFLFLDEDFFINKRRVEQFIDLVEKEKLHFNWRMWCRVDHFKDNYINTSLLSRLEKIGYGSLVMGGESGNQETLTRLNKGTTLEQIENSLKALIGRRITPRYSFIVGLENENMRQIRDTYEFCYHLKRLHSGVDIAGPFVFRLYPGSKIYNSLIRRYSIFTPSKLEQWRQFLERGETFTHMPWVPRKFGKASMFLEYYNTHAMQDTKEINSVKDILRKILHISARLRVKFFFFHFPIEFWLAKYFIK